MQFHNTLTRILSEIGSSGHSEDDFDVAESAEEEWKESSDSLGSKLNVPSADGHSSLRISWK